jgi:catechol 2,3-dioxygenase-like lactoylglutathione lyase family enzyme
MSVGGLHQVALHADDLERATAFYRDVVGLRLVASFDPPGLAFFELGGVSRASPRASEQPAGVRLLLEHGAPASLLYLLVDDIDAEQARLAAAGVTFASSPHLVHHDADGTFGAAGVGEWMTFFHDSEGNLVALVERRAG